MGIDNGDVVELLIERKTDDGSLNVVVRRFDDMIRLCRDECGDTVFNNDVDGCDDDDDSEQQK